MVNGLSFHCINVLFSCLCMLFVMVSCKSDTTQEATTNMEMVDGDSIRGQLIDSLEINLPVKRQLTLDNGIDIVWLEQPNGERIQAGDVVLIDYKVRLSDSTIIDGNHLLNKPHLPYIVGFGFQPKGWDIAFEHLHVGDFVKIHLPAALARGKKGVKGLIPDNADNFLTIRILSKMAPTREVDGVKIWLLEESVSFTRSIFS